MMNSSQSMRQDAPYPHLLETLVEKINYKRGWTFSLENLDRGQGSMGLTLIINILEPDTYEPKRFICVNHYMIVPPAAFDERSWKRWLFDQVLLVEQHEASEFFEIEGVRPYAPHHAPGRNPYAIIEQGSLEDATTDYRGRRFTVDEKGAKKIEELLK
jgi:hypothetical protein